MNKKIFICLFTVLFTFPVFSQEKKTTAEAVKKPAVKEKSNTSLIKDTLYSEEVLEDFEQTVYTNKNITFRKFKDRQDAKIGIRDEFAAPKGNSKKYLGIKIFGKRGDSFSIKPEKELVIKKRCQSIAFWVYGKGFSGQFSAYIRDAEGKAHRLTIGTLNFRGWRKLIVKLPKRILQEDRFLNQKRYIKITKLIYRPGNTPKRHPIWQYFYIDDISAMVRKKYTDRQSDDW